jgi:hypothetical protein
MIQKVKITRLKRESLLRGGWEIRNYVILVRLCSYTSVNRPLV